jgi:hypothetical protein
MRLQSLLITHSEYFSKMVSAATLAPPGSEIQTFLKCRKRPDRKPCPGEIIVRLEENPPQLHWWCSACGNNGVIKNWKGVIGAIVHTEGDVSCGHCDCSVRLNTDEYSSLKEINIIEPQAKSAVSNAHYVNDELVEISGSVTLFNTILGYIAFEANQSEKRNRYTVFDNLINKIKRQLSACI